MNFVSLTRVAPEQGQGLQKYLWIQSCKKNPVLKRQKLYEENLTDPELKYNIMKPDAIIGVRTVDKLHGEAAAHPEGPTVRELAQELG